MMLPTASVYALGMGEIEVHSALNEPLKAQIKLLSTTAAEVGALQVSLASDEAFGRMGIERTAVLRDLRFSVVTQGAGAPYISIKSSTPMREPFLDLILMASWSNGQLMREYTLLLDPPVFDSSQAVAPVRAAKTQSAVIDRGQKKVAATPAPAAATPSPRTAGSYGPTTRTDTLWHVAREMRPSSSVSVPQMMIALLKENPDAFIDGNVNNLKAGHILRLPPKDIINSISNSEAVAETNRHYQAWQTADVDPSTVNQRAVATPATEAAAPAKTSTPTTAASTTARLKLLSPEDGKQQGGTGVSGKGGGNDVTEQLAMALETAEATKQENAELKARLSDIERQLEAVQRLLTLKGDTLGTLQAGLGDATDPQAVAPVVVEPAAVAESTASAPEPEGAKSEPAVAVPSGAGLVEQILADPVLLAAAAGGPLLFLLIVALIRRRRQQSQLHDADAVTLDVPIVSDLTPKAVAGSGAGAVSKLVAEERDFSGMTEEAVSTDFNVSSSGMGAIQTEDSEIDPIAEADVYLAYRRYEQAEALLKEAIRQDGGRSELKLKLLEIYFTTKDKEAFEAQAEALYASLGGQEDDLWVQAVEMGREIASDHPLFAESGASQSATGVTTARAAAVAAVADDSFTIDTDSPDFADEFSFDLSDDDLASSLNLSALDDGDTDIGQDVVDLEGLEPAPSSLDDMDFGLGGDFSLDEGIEELAEQQAGIDDVAPQYGGSGRSGGTGAGFDDVVTGVKFDQPSAPQKSGLTVVGSVKDSVKSEAWTIAPAVSSFQSRDVKTEMDDGYVPVTNVSKASLDTKNLDHLSLGENDSGQGDELDMFDGGSDIVGTKLDLARAYIDMGDQRGARSILDEVVKEGGDSHRQEAEQLMRQIS